VLRRKRDRDLPGLAAVSIDAFGWPKVASTDFVVQWRGEADQLSLNYFPVVPDVSRPPGDDLVLQEQLRAGEEAGGYALVEARWVQGPSGRPVARLILKMPQEGSGMGYVGSLILPFASCSWVVKLQCFEVGVTGMRESIWLNEHLSRGGSLEEAGIDTSAEPLGPDDPRPPVRRVPADDPEWDGLVPQHPLSRLRRGLPPLLESIKLSRAATRLAAFE
jgi:hypothetical protein